MPQFSNDPTMPNDLHHDLPTVGMTDEEAQKFADILNDYEDVLLSEEQMNYKWVNNWLFDHGDDNHCAIIAVVMVTGRHPAYVRAMMEACGRKRKHGPSMKIVFAVIKKVTGLYHYNVTRFMPLGSLRAAKYQMPAKGMFLLSTHDHVSAVVDGECDDLVAMQKKYIDTVYYLTDSDVGPMSPGEFAKPKRNVVVNYEKPTKAVWEIADILFEQQDPPVHGKNVLYTKKDPDGKKYVKNWWAQFRAAVVAECMANGINETTANVQVGKWCKENA